MQLGLVGLGKMGANMAERVRRAGIEVVGYDRSPGKRDVDSLEALIAALEGPRIVWVMVPSGEPTRATVRELGDLLSPGDVIIDGGNSKFTDDKMHAELLGPKGIGYIDAGVSGGVWGLENGYALMVGGSAEDVAKAQPVFDALKPPTPHDESGDAIPGAGFVHAGPCGAGHFAKMVHNGIEYAMMQAYGEGYELLAAVDLIEDVPGVVASWTQGTVIRSWLLDLLVRALQEDPALEKITGYAEDSGEGRWTVEQAIEHAVPMPAISASLFARFASRQEDSPTMKAVAALRNQFGGHAVQAVQQQEAEKPA
ncbi:6-phosphogluconate dehydrogenase (decarboxylating) [Modestobacter roseus]|uniref:6-phosphogluconate dehydrogenase (Decarboxylating) n=1 Tax=Modestobacter roseus TaxID=1181884 RepID=A0A562IWM6_9ACTN|nr:decarboxylating 6-phosphogluconate dehydrogenase [Modestobacter roseus]MQA33438.1 decarboxylating 6-phosphogluconate dehydrogenase [Modestobacter roseus]TWH74974.1 6-phosphogluconate dehydrogenase (decarboxylating) [Modestobacter roseus]